MVAFFYAAKLTENEDYIELELPEPRIHVYKETFGNIVDVTDEWYKITISMIIYDKKSLHHY